MNASEEQRSRPKKVSFHYYRALIFKLTFTYKHGRKRDPIRRKFDVQIPEGFLSTWNIYDADLEGGKYPVSAGQSQQDQDYPLYYENSPVAETTEHFSEV